ncbi:DNA recombination protein RmuC [Marisediminicola sp. LYQ134]|uniref:DNA recombination protein RmuC n=1 Tax=Marisediminicola sp. LYQ134 TaxID=3391061 RepID=UPI003983A9F9
MDVLIPLLLGTLLGLASGVVLGTWFAARRGRTSAPLVDAAVAEARHDAELARVQAHADAERLEIAARLAGAEATVVALREQVGEHADRYRDLVDAHEAERLAAEARRRDESTVLQALTPVQETLRAMQLKVADLETQRSAQHGELSERLRTAAAAEERLRSTTDSLASALRNNSVRGVWGETQLRSVVESAGLLERVDFDVQSSISSDAGAGRPDMVVRLPGGKSIAVDAKVPFTAYLEASAIAPTAPPAELARRDALLKQHVKAVRDHITTLGSRAYWQGLDASPEMVIAFIPNESLVSSALEADPTIMEFAFSKRVALSSPVTLWSVLKTVAFSWQQDLVTREAKEFFDVSRELYGRLATMAGHLDKLGRSLTSSVTDYNKFVGSLERQVLPSARRLSSLDESKIVRAPSEIEVAPRALAAFELTAELDEIDDPRADRPDAVEVTPADGSRSA